MSNDGEKEVCTIEATVVTGFESTAQEECREKLKVPAKWEKGRIFFDMPVDRVSDERSYPTEMSERRGEVRGKSWRREREERGRRQQQLQQQKEQALKGTAYKNQDAAGDLSAGKEMPLDPPRKTSIEETSCSDSSSKSQMNNFGNSKENSPSQVALVLGNEEGDGKIQSTPNNEDEVSVISEEKEFDQDSTLQKENEEKEQLETYITGCLERLRVKAELRQANADAAANRPEEAFFSKLDSSLKKNTAFVKKLRNMTEAQKDSLIRDMAGLNLTKYISEVAAAIVDAKLKMSDVNTAVQICSLLNQRYADFAPQLLENWQKVLSLKKDEKISNPSKVRVDLRFYAELISCGVFTLKEGPPLLGNLLTVLMSTDKEEHNNLNILLSFCKHCGEDYAGLVPRKIRILSERYGREIPKSDLLAPDRQKGLRTLLKEYYKSLCRHLIKDHKNLQNLERQNRRILQTKGELSQERKEKFEASQIAFQKLLSSAQQFADILDEDVPEFPTDHASQDGDSISLAVHNRFKDGEMEGGTSLWEDDDTRSFYENLPDLKAFIPGILFKDSSQVALVAAQLMAEAKEAGIEGDISKLEIEEAELVEAEEEKIEDIEPRVEIPTKVEEKDLTETLLQELTDADDELSTNVNSTNKVLLEGFLSSLLNCVNREMIDQAAVDFCMKLNTKPNRKKLVRTLFLVPRTRLDLLPFYARFVAILFPCMPDIANDLVTMLKQDFKFHMRKKDQINIESKVKTVRFIGELVKFKIFPKSEALYCLKVLLSDFTHHHIEMACNLLETCGRFLFRSPDSHQRTKVYLEQMMRKKAVRALDSRYITMIENAFYYCNPPETPATAKIERPAIHEYIRKLLYKDLSKNNTEKILRQMRKLNWEDPSTCSYATKCLTAVWHVKYYNIRCVANLLAGLVAYQESIGPQVVDGVLEDIRLGMEVNHPKYHQRRVSMVRYLGELYNYRMVESSVIFRALYSFITFGVYYDGTYSEIDPPDSLFRIRLVCTLLDTCGQYFNSGSSKKKLDCFLVFFQRYYWFKRSNEIFNEEYPFPVQVEFNVKDIIANLRPKFKMYESYEEALTGVEELMNELKPKLVELFPSLSLSVDEKEHQDASVQEGLGPIQEEAEPDDDLSGDGTDHDADLDMDVDIDFNTGSGSQSQPIEMENDATPDVEAFGSVSEDEGVGCVIEGDNEVTLLNAVPKLVPCQEDEDFMAEFDKMLSESMSHRSQEPVKPQVDIVIPMNLKGSNKKTSFVIDNHVEHQNTINFTLMMRQGNKPQFKNLDVPMTSELAQNLKDRKEAERAEKEQVKKLTLDINERQEEEDYQEMLAAQQRPVVMNLNRDRRHKYQHPKGAPDADLIFGNKM